MNRTIVTLITATVAACVVHAEKVASISVESVGPGKVNEAEVLARCRVKAGAEYAPSACSRDVKALRDSGEYEDITVRASQGNDGIDLVFAIRRKPVFHGPLKVTGNDYWGESKIAKFAELKDGFACGAADLAAAAGRVRREYLKKSFPDVKVTPVSEAIPGSDGGISVTLQIVEGERRKIGSFGFTGNLSVDADDLRTVIDVYPWWNPIGWFTDEPVTEQDFAEARDKISALYRDKGFLDVDVSLPIEEKGEDGKISRVFTIREGTKYTVGKMSVTGVTKYPADAALAANKSLAGGDVAGAAAMAAAAHDIEVFCGSGTNALAETRVDVHRVPSESDPTVLDIVFAVEEGVPVTINRVLIRGNDYTKDKVIRREISLSPGDPMLSDLAERSQRRLENLRYFERVRYYLEKTDVPSFVAQNGATNEYRDLVFEVAEKNTGNFMVGIGASSVDSVYGYAEISESNFDILHPWRFRGGGQKARALVQAGPRVQTYEVSITEPHLFDRLLELTVEGYRRQRWYDDYDIIRNGASVTLAYPVKFWPTWRTFGRLGVRASAEFIQFDDVEDDRFYTADMDPEDSEPRRLFKEEEDKYGDNWEVPFRLFWEDDTRDSFIFAKRGHRISLYGDVVTGDNEYWRAGFNYRQYLTVWKRYGHVVSFGLRGETVDAFSGHQLPIYDREFLGGPRSIRGVEYREIAPRVYRSLRDKKHDYAPWGGQTSWCMNLEYAVPVVKFVRVAGFTDLGSVGEDEFDLDNDWFCWSVGVGLRLDLPQFPIRLDFAVPVTDPDEGVDEQVFSFTVGYDF